MGTVHRVTVKEHGHRGLLDSWQGGVTTSVLGVFRSNPLAYDGLIALFVDSHRGSLP